MANYETKRRVPAIAGTSPKLCPKCGKWFAAGKRQRVCEECLPPGKRTLRRASYGQETAGQGLSVSGAHNHTNPGSYGQERAGQKGVKTQGDALLAVTRRNIALGLQDSRDEHGPNRIGGATRDLALEALAQGFTSYACHNPREHQAEIPGFWQGRRHPYAGTRPQWSGFCTDLECACKCHRKQAAGG